MKVHLGPFEIQSRFATGGMGEIYRGVHTGLDTPVAIKVITGPNALVPEYQEEFRREVQAVARLAHPNIVQVFDYGVLPEEVSEISSDLVPGAPYLVMEYASRGSLANQIEPLNWRDLKNILVSVLGALSHAHARNVIHRDIKPGNVLLGSYHETPPRIILTDFGVAHATDSQTRTDAMEFTSRSTEEASGTPRYMAPEQFMGKWRDYGPWTDLYSVGIMAYHLACGELPFQGATFMMLAMAHINNDFPALKPRIDVPDGFEDWVHRMCEKKFTDRYQSAADAAWGLMELNDSALLFSELSAIAGEHEEEDDFDDSTDMLPTRIDFAPPEALRVFTMSKTETQDYPDAPAMPLTWEEAEPPTAELSMLGAGLGLLGLRAIPVVGREGLRTTLWDSFKSVYFDGEPRVVVLRGLSGTGKTRMAEWIGQLSEEIGAGTVFVASHSPTGGPTHGLSFMLTTHFRSAGLTAEDMGERVDEYLDREGVSDQTETRALTEIMRSNLVEADRTSKFMAFQSMAHRYGFIRRVLERASHRRPVVCILDDAQWSWDSLGFVKDVLEADEKHPVFFVVTIKDEALVEQPDEQRALAQLLVRPETIEVFVDPLSEEDISDLVRAHLGLPDDLAENVAEQSGGSPLFAIQLVEDWVKRGILETDGQHFVVRRGETATLPQDLAALWESRINFLVEQLSMPDSNESRIQILVDPDVARRSLELAAALGRDVVTKEWLEVCDRARVKAVVGIVDEMIRLRMATPLPETEGFSFINIQLWEALIRSAKNNERWVSHNMKCAQVLTSLYDTEQPGLAQRVGRHFLAAKAYQLAITCLEEAYQRAHGASEHGETDAILELLERSYEEMDIDSSDSRWAELWVRRGVPMIYAEDQETFDAGVSLLTKAERASRAAGHNKKLVSILRAQAWAAALSDSPEDGLEKINEAIELSGDKTSMLAPCKRTLGHIKLVTGDYTEAEEALQETLSLAPDSIPAVWAQVELGACAWRLGRFDEAETLLELGRQQAEQHDIKLACAVVHEVLGHIAFQKDDYQTAYDEHAQAFEIREMTGDGSTTRKRSWELMARSAVLLGNYDEAKAIASQLQRALQGGARAIFVHPADLLLAIAAGQQEWDDWDDLVESALQFDRPIESWHVEILINAGRSAMRAGEATRGREMLEQLLEMLDSEGLYEELQVEVTELVDDFAIEEELDELTMLQEEFHQSEASDDEVEEDEGSEAESSVAEAEEPEDEFGVPEALEQSLGTREDSEPDEEYSGVQIVNIADIAAITDQSSGSFAAVVPDSGFHKLYEDPDETGELEVSEGEDESEDEDVDAVREFAATGEKPGAEGGGNTAIGNPNHLWPAIDRESDVSEASEADSED